MTIARAHLVDPSVSRWYHCITRCLRRAFLLGEGPSDRKVWIENRLRELAEIFGVAVAGFSVLDNHLHVLVWLNPGPWRGNPKSETRNPKEIENPNKRNSKQQWTFA